MLLRAAFIFAASLSTAVLPASSGCLDFCWPDDGAMFKSKYTSWGMMLSAIDPAKPAVGKYMLFDELVILDRDARFRFDGRVSNARLESRQVPGVGNIVNVRTIDNRLVQPIPHPSWNKKKGTFIFEEFECQYNPKTTTCKVRSGNKIVLTLENRDDEGTEFTVYGKPTLGSDTLVAYFMARLRSDYLASSEKQNRNSPVPLFNERYSNLARSELLGSRRPYCIPFPLRSALDPSLIVV